MAAVTAGVNQELVKFQQNFLLTYVNSQSSCRGVVTWLVPGHNRHFLKKTNNMLLIPIEKIFSNRDSIRKAREAFLIHKGRTIAPDGLNIREESY